MSLLLWTLLACPPKVAPGPAANQVAQQPVRVLQERDTAAPNVYLQAMVRAGSAYDRTGEEGLAHLVAVSLREAGAGDLDGAAFTEALYPTGNDLDVLVDREWVSLRLTCHTDQAELCVDRFADALVHPRFDSADVERSRDDALYAVTDEVLSDEEALGHEVFDNWIFDAHPYGHPIQGRAGTLPTLDASDARRFHGDHYVREAVLAGIGGNFDDELLAHFQDRLSDLPGTRAPELPLQAPVPVQGRALLAVDTETPVTGFHFGHPIALGRSHADYVPLHLGLYAFGAHRQSHGRLFRTMRTARGLNYGDYAYVEPFVQRGWTSLPEQGAVRRQNYFYVWIRPTSTDNGPFALKLAIDEVEKLVADGLSEDEFAAVKRNLRLGTPLSARDPGRRLAYALEAAATGTPDNQGALLERLDAVTLEQVNAALKAHLRPDDLRIVAVSGEAKALVAALEGDEPTPIVYSDVEPSEAQAKRDQEVAGKALNITPGAKVVGAEGIFR